MTIDTERLRELAAELGFWPATTDEADIDRHRQHNKNADYWLARTEDLILAANECEGCVLVDGTVGGTIEGGDIGAIVKQLADADRMGYAGVWSTEVARDPFLPVLLAAEHTPRLAIGTAIAVAFARNPMSMATVANDLQSLSSGKFMLGLGSQIKAHIERRFSMPWSRPADRMREFVAAMHAIWDSWHNDQPLDFEARDKRDRITYDSLWVHAKRHYDLAGTTAYWRARMDKELMKALGGNERTAYRITTNKYQ